MLLLLGSLPLLSQGILQIPSGANLKMTGGAFLGLNNTSLVNNSTLQQAAGAGVLQFSGTTTVHLSGTGTTTLDNLWLSLSGSAVLELQANAGIVTSVNFLGGLLDLGTSSINLGTTGILSNESESSHAFASGSGTIIASGVLNAPSSVNLGNLGATITSSSSLGSTTITRGHSSQVNGQGAGNSILRYYIITPANDAGLNATLQFNYFTAELNGLDPNSLDLFGSPDGSTWTDMGFSVRNSSPDYVEQTGLSTFSTWTLSSAGNPLPVNFVYFNATCVNGNPDLRWETGEESGSEKFDIEKSTGGTTWQVIGSVPAAGTSDLPHNYSYSDNTAGGAQTLYRIVEYDYNGNSIFSPVIKSGCSVPEELTLYPNPVRDQTLINVYLDQPATVKIWIVDGGGAIVQQKEIVLPAGNNQFPLSLGYLAKGIYTISAHWGERVRSVKLFKE